MKRILSVLLMLCMVFGALSFAGAEGPVQLTYWADLGSTGASVMSSWDDNMAMQKLQEITGVDLVFQDVVVGQATEQFNLMIASRELPDIIEYNWSSYSGGVQKAIDDGIIIPLNDLIDQYCPNYKALFEDYPDYAKQIKTDEGIIPVFAAFSISDYNCTSGFQIRKDWLDAQGLEVPTNINEWEETLLALMDAYDLECGIAYGTGVYSDSLVGCWDIGSAYYVDNGTIKYGPIEDAYLDYLTTMKRWYDEGILDPDFAALNDNKTIQNYMINGEAAACFGAVGGLLGNIYTAVEAKGDTEFCQIGVAYPDNVNGGPHRFISMSWQYRGTGSAAITTACKNQEAACRVLDYFYGDEGRILKSFGVEGISFEYVDGVPTYTDLLLHNPDGLSMSQAMYLYVRCNSPWPGFIETGYHEQYFARQVQKDAAHAWNLNIENTKETKLPMVSLTSEESLEMATMTSLINDYRNEHVLKFIMGQEPLENYPQFVNELKSLGVERVLEIYQAAYERYLNR